MSDLIKLNLGCGKNLIPGFINVDKYGEPDVQHDLEVFPWPWDDSSVSDIVMSHVLEHLGKDTETYFCILKEMYRVCADQAIIQINVPHPRHDFFIDDPTHVRPITPNCINLLSKKQNDYWVEIGASNTQLGYILDVDFEITHTELVPDEEWVVKIREQSMSPQELHAASRKHNNVVQEYRMTVKVIK